MQIKERFRIAILYAELAGYTIACLEALKKKYNAEILLVSWNKANVAPFEFTAMEYAHSVYSRENLTESGLSRIMQEFQPDAIFISGWMDRLYLKVAGKFKKKNIPVIAGIDGQWRGTVRQHVASLFSSLILHSGIDCVWVTGERQARFARKLGYGGEHIWYGLYSCDWEKFSGIYRRRGPAKPGKFLYVGRLVNVKGIEHLITAYERYVQVIDDPWELHIAGTGPLQNMIENKSGIRYHGFLQPEKLPSLMEDCGVFILPSISEPWGVVIHEAVAAGMPVICSDACGAGVHLVQDGYNGYIFQSGNVEHLTSQMIQMSSLDNTGFRRMGEASFELSKQFTPGRWADTLINGIERFKKNK